ncbi:glycosyltransferase family 4 protein [Citricoccus nitrophenolicus]|uniref:Glycosyltransferase family 4 protein n=2 Tax=Citricoccus TaxID=169133 RepID=A0ABV0ILL2_9MICC
MDGRFSGDALRVASIPYNQVYIRHLEAVEGERPTRVRRLPDPHPAGGSRFTQSGWWPPAMLSAQWVAQHHTDFDLMHVHFGFDAVSPADLAALIDELRRHGKPLVYTAHDLRNPHHRDPQAHDAQLDLLVPAADRVITLTQGAATEIRRRWGVDAIVLPHPHVVDFPTMERLQGRRLRMGTGPEPPSASPPFRIGVHLKSLRENMDPGIVEPLAAAVSGLGPAELVVNLHREVLDPGSTDYRADLDALLRGGHADGRWVLDVHDYYDERAFFGYLASLDVSVLPYRFGTHSGWLEACRDVGTSVIAPSCGHYRDQHPSVVEYAHDERGLDAASLRDAVHLLYRHRPWPAPSVAERKAQRRDLAAEHERLYEAVLASRSVDAVQG